MRNRISAKSAALVLALVIASLAGAMLVAGASCNFSVEASPASVTPGSNATFTSRCLHDGFGNPISGSQIDFTVTKPDATVVNAGSGTTNASGDATAPAFSDTTAYGTYTVTATSAVNNAITASTTFTAGGGSPAGTFDFSKTAGTAAGDQVDFLAENIKDANGNAVANGTVVTVTVSLPTTPVTTKVYTAAISGVTAATDNAHVTVSMPAADTHLKGNYQATAKAGGGSTPATSNPNALAFSLTAACAKTLTLVAPSTVTIGAQTTAADKSFGANGIKDAYNNVANGASLARKFTDPASGVTNDSLVADANGSAVADVFFDATDQLYGSYTFDATACDATGTKTVTVGPGAATSIASASGPVSNVPAGTSATVTANGIVNDYMDHLNTAKTAAIKNGSSVTLTVVSPSAVTRTYTETVSGVDSAADVAGVSFLIPGTDTTVAGNYTGTVKSGTATAAISFTVIPGPPVPDMTLAASDVTVGNAGNVDVSNIPASAASVQLIVTRPDATSFTLTNSAPFTNNATAFVLTAAQLDQLGEYGLNAIALDNTSSIVAGGSSSFKVLSGSLGIAAPDIAVSAANTVTVSGLPVGTKTVTLLVTKPDATTYAPANITLTTTQTSVQFTIPATQTGQAGTYGLASTAKNNLGQTIATATGSFKVITLIPDRIDVTTSATGAILPEGFVSITAKAVKTGTPDLPIPGRRLYISIRNFLGQVVVSGYQTTPANGTVSWSASGTQTLCPGTYHITVSDTSPGGTASNSSATFDVIVAL